MTAANSVALGASSSTTANLSAAGYKPGATAVSGVASAANGEVSVGSSGNERRVTNIAAGAAATDAVNVSQLQSEAANVDALGTSTASALGGGAAYNSGTGAIAKPTYTIGGKTYNDVGTALVAAEGASADAVKYDSAAHDSVTLGNAGTPVRVTNVKAGALNATSKDAVNGSQLFATNEQVAANTGDITTINSTVSAIDGRVTQNTTDISTINTTISTINGSLADAVQYDSATHDSVTLGNAGTPVQVTNVKAGALDATSKDAVNGSQLFATNEQVAANTGDITTINSTVSAIDGRVTQNTTDISTISGSLADAVKYDSATHDSVTLGNAGTPVQVTNVKAGALDATSKDAVNGSQLFATNEQVAANTGDIITINSTVSAIDGRVTQNTTDISTINTTISTINGSLADAVQYDSAAHDSVTLGNAGTPVQVTNVKAGALNATSKDAVNGSQLFATNEQVAANTGDITTINSTVSAIDGRVTQNTTDISTINTTISTINGSLADAVQYDSAAHDSVTLGNAGTPVQVTNVKAGALDATSKDAVNGSQLFATNEQVAANTGDITSINSTVSAIDGRVTQNTTDISTINTTISTINGSLADAVQYDSAAHDSITLGNAGTPVQVTNVKAGALDATSKDAVNGSQLFATNEQVAANTGDITTINSTVSAIDGRVTQNTTDISTISGSLADAVKYDSATHDSVTLGNAGTPVQVTNVKAGALDATSKDAVNGSQLFATNEQVAANTGDIITINSTVSAIDGRVTQNTTDISTINTTISTINGSLADAVQYDSAAHDSVTLGNAGTPVQVTNVKAGALNATSKDAVNGSQLFATNEQVAANTGDITTINSTVSSIDGRVTQNTTDISTINTTISTINGSLADAVQYDSAAHDSVTLGNAGTPVQVTNVKAGALDATSKDAVNGSQLFATNEQVAANTGDITTINSTVSAIDGRVTQNTTDISTINTTISTINGSLADAVQYDSAAHDSITLGNAGTPVQVTNVKAGALDATSKDAVNGSQLFATNEQVAANTGDITTINSTVSAIDGRVTQNTTDISTINTTISTINGSLADAVQYDSAAHDSVLLGNAGTPVRVTNVKAGALNATSKDAVNGSQLFATNEQVATNTGDITTITNNLSNGSIGLVQQDATSRAISVAKNTDGLVVDVTGTAGVRRVTGVADGALSATSKDAVNGSQLFATNEQVATNTGDITTINSTVSAIDGRVTQNTTDISTINTTISTINGSLADAVQYDSAAHDSITLGNAGTPVQVTNVKAGALNATSKDAVNGSQLFATNEQLATNTDDIADITNNLNNGSLGLVQQDQATRNISVARDTDGNRVDFTGTTGTRELLGVSAGTTMSSAINLSQLQPVVAGLGGGATVNPDGSVTGPTYSVQGSTQTDVGSALNALDSGLTSLSDKVNGTDLGLVAQDGTTRDITIGAKTDGAALNVAGTAGNRKVTGVANGDIAAASVDAINGSQLAGVSTSVVNAIGGGSVLNSDGSISLPTFNVGGTTTHNIGDALTSIDGRVTQSMTEITNLKTTVNNQGTGAGSPNAVSYDTEAHAKVTFGKDGTPTSLTNVADGTLSAASTDAVNGRQLFATNTKVEQLGEAIRNVSTTGSTATGFGPSVGGEAPVAIATGGGSIAIGDGANSSGDNAVSIGSGSAASAENSVALGAHSVADQPNTVSIGSDGNERRLTNVAPGINGTDAVNMNQLQSGMGEVARNAYSGVAAATALSMIPEVDADKTLSVGFGYGSYKGYSAGAFGGTARVTKNLKLRAGAGWGSGGKTVGTGGSYQW